jgi:hypothetical protein
MMITITNQCTCVSWNETTHEYDEAPECWGDCYSTSVEDFEQATQELFDNHGTEWRIDGFPTWYGKQSGTFTAKNAQELLRSITPERTEWTLSYETVGNSLKCVLSHHDAPTGGSMTVTPL